MSRLRVAPIVEGHGEVQSARTLLERIWRELLGGDYLEVIRPIRQPRSKLVKEEELRRAVGLAALKLHEHSVDDPALVLLLLDADKDAPCLKGPELLALAKAARPDIDIACVLANVEFETWFVGSAESLTDFLDFLPDEVPPDPEANRSSKNWIETHFRGTKYSETVDQPRMTARMDLQACRSRCPSFDKLCRELERRISRGLPNQQTEPTD